MNLNSLTAISPIDGRYYDKASSLAAYFSEFGLIRYRIRVEIEYFIALTYALPELSSIPKEKEKTLRNIYVHFSEEDAAAIKEIEKITNMMLKQ